MLLVRHPLRAGDAIWLASALVLQRQLEEAVSFSASDERLVSSATWEGLSVLA